MVGAVGAIFEMQLWKKIGNSFPNSVGYRYCPGKTKVPFLAMMDTIVNKYDAFSKTICKI